MRKFKFTDWPEVQELAWSLGELVEPAFHPDVIIAIARGGLVVGRILADYFSVMELYTVNIETAGTQTYRKAETRVRAPFSLPLEGRCVLVVDEVASSGYSLQAVERFAYANGGRAVKTAVLVHLLLRSIIRPDFCIQECAEEVWHTYPWTIVEDLGHLAQQDAHIGALVAAGQYAKVRDYLDSTYSLGLPQKVIRAVLERSSSQSCVHTGKP